MWHVAMRLDRGACRWPGRCLLHVGVCSVARQAWEGGRNRNWIRREGLGLAGLGCTSLSQSAERSAHMCGGGRCRSVARFAFLFRFVTWQRPGTTRARTAIGGTLRKFVGISSGCFSKRMRRTRSEVLASWALRQKFTVSELRSDPAKLTGIYQLVTRSTRHTREDCLIYIE